MGMRARLGLEIARDLKQHMTKFMRYESSCSAAAAEEKRLYLYFEEVTASERGIMTSRFPIRSVKLSYLLSPSSSTTTRADEFVHALKARLPPLHVPVRRRWAGTFANGLILFSAPASVPGEGSCSNAAAAIKSCSSRSKGKLNKNFPVIKSIKRDKCELLFLEGEVWEDGKLYTISLNNLLQVLDARKKKWVSLEGPPPLDGQMFNCVVCNNKVLLWYPGKKGAANCFDVSQPKKGWSSAPPSWGRYIPFLTCTSPLLLEHDQHDYLLLFTFSGDEYELDGSLHDHKIKVFLMSHQCGTFQSLNQAMQLPEDTDVPSFFWDRSNHCVSPLNHQFVHLGGHKICLVLHRFFYDDPYASNNPGRDKGFIVLITFEYEINIKSLDIEYRLLTVRNLEYADKHNSKFVTCAAQLDGDVVL